MKSEINLDQYLDILDENVGAARAMGYELKLHREKLGLSLENIAYQTYISVRFLEAIEQGDYKILPGGDTSRGYGEIRTNGKAYIKGFIRSYAKCVNFNGKIELEISESLQLDRELDVRSKQQPEATLVVQSRRPPWLAEFLLYLFLTKEERVYLIGDLAEEYDDVLDRFGAKKADLWFYKQVWTSLHPLILRALRRLRTVIIVVGVINKLRGL